MTVLVRAGASTPYQPNFHLKTKDTQDVKVLFKERPCSPESHRWSVGKSMLDKMQRGFHKIHDKIQAKKILEQEERGYQMEGAGLLVFQD